MDELYGGRSIVKVLKMKEDQTNTNLMFRLSGSSVSYTMDVTTYHVHRMLCLCQTCSDLSADPGASGVRLFDTADDVEQHLRSDMYPWRNQTSSEMLCGAVIFDTEPWSQQARTG